ncbi:MAG: hypothetical protein PHQ14_02650, partial [Chromatiales bacterium]|nr:hypothetical protein [Chromatiales bacterium]
MSRTASLTLAPQSALGLATALTLLLAAGALWLALALPAFGQRFEARNGALIVLDADDPRTLAALLDTDDQTWPQAPLTAADLLIDEPDHLETYARFNAFIETQERLTATAVSGRLTALTEDGETLTFEVRERHLSELPWLFWYQLAVGASAFLLAAGVWAFRRGDPAARNFALSALGLLIACFSAAVYSTRPLLIDGDWVYRLSMLNLVGSLSFTAAFTAMLWHYPQRIARWPLPALAYTLASLFWLAEFLQWAPEMNWGRYVSVLILFAPSFPLAALQWWHTRGRPVERAALKWFLLSLYLGTGLFAGIMLIPLALGQPPLAGQGLMFIVFLFMFAGIALGITRYRLFELDVWWFRAWSWFLGGVAVIALDLLLVSLLGMSQTLALALALALLGWVWFPLRQWVWRRLAPGAAADPRARIEHWAGALFAARDRHALLVAWRRALEDGFAPLQVRSLGESVTGLRIADDGQTLYLPTPDGVGGFCLAHPQRGGRLFRGDDLAAVELLTRLAARALHAQAARERGAGDERRRIMRDLHDDIGAKLLSLVYLQENSRGEQLARSALQDMREILSALEADAAPVAETIAAWRAEAQQRADERGIELEWSGEANIADGVYGARERTNLGRILREAVTNAIRHAEPQRLRVSVNVADGRTRLAVEDDGCHGGPSADWKPGRGGRVILTRAGDLGGHADWDRSPELGGWRLRVNVPA